MALWVGGLLAAVTGRGLWKLRLWALEWTVGVMWFVMIGAGVEALFSGEAADFLLGITCLVTGLTVAVYLQIVRERFT